MGSVVVPYDARLYRGRGKGVSARASLTRLRPSSGFVRGPLLADVYDASLSNSQSVEASRGSEAKWTSRGLAPAADQWTWQHGSRMIGPMKAGQAAYVE